MTGRIAALYRHPVKGFTPERLDSVELTSGAPFPCDRIFAVENGPSGFDPAAPAHVAKNRFTVLMAIPRVARARTAYDERTGVLTAAAEGLPPFAGRLTDELGRNAFAEWLEQLIGEDRRGPLKVLAPSRHRFLDHPQGDVSIVNLASVRDLEARTGRVIDPLRFRANIYVDGWPAWAETEWTGRDLRLGEAGARVFKPIVRCAATHVDPATGERDFELVRALFDHYGHTLCGIYAHVSQAGRLAVGDACPQPQLEPQP
jgi:uncharacterized protein